MSWNQVQKIFFRLFVTYVVLFSTTANASVIFNANVMWNSLALWFGNNLLGYELGTDLYNSGNLVMSEVAMHGLLLSISIVAVLIWTTLDYKRKNYNQLMQWFIVWVRFVLISEMIVYGFTKLFFVQFGELTTEGLEVRVGDLSPMDLIWTMMAYSKGYTVFSGILQLTGGFFLIFRKTQTLGALIISGVMINVVALNFFYDISVKVFSVHLLVLALFLVSLDAKRMIDFFLRNSATEPKEHISLFKSKRAIRIKNVVKFSMLAVMVTYYLSVYIKIRYEMDRYYAESGMMGEYAIQIFDRTSSQTVTLDDWKELKVGVKNSVEITCVGGKNLLYEAKIDSLNRYIVLQNRLDRGVDTLQIKRLNNDYAAFHGVFQEDTLHIGLRKNGKGDYKLTRRQ